MKKYLLLTLAFILTACSDPSAETVEKFYSKYNDQTAENYDGSPTADFKMVFEYRENGELLTTTKYTYDADEDLFDVENTITQDGIELTMTYRAFNESESNRIEDLKVVDQNGEEYELDSVPRYRQIIREISQEMVYLYETSKGTYSGIKKSSTDTEYSYQLKSAFGILITYTIPKDGQSYDSIQESEEDNVVVTTHFEFI